MKAEFNAENGLVSASNNGTLVILDIGDTEFRMTISEAKQFLKILKVII